MPSIFYHQIGIVDGSGVLFDPLGIDRTELLRLATKRQMICNFNMERLGIDGFRVLVDERNVKLPSGEIVEDGLSFRNEFHLSTMSSADLFVPCGGRPESVDINNVSKLLNSDGLPRFKYIVEGANLFFTQVQFIYLELKDARIHLENAGAIIFKDASANKGGVTSSSLEVLAALALNDEEFNDLMVVKNGIIPKFYSDYIKNVHKIIENNSNLEFESIWNEHMLHPYKTKSLISDELSIAITSLDDEIQLSGSLWSEEGLRRVILQDAIPNVLLQQVGLDVILQRIPESYQIALFSSYLASRFIYKYGIQPSQFAFFEFMSGYRKM